jgi:cytochrome c-type biogenesis protein CcmE
MMMRLRKRTIILVSLLYIVFILLAFLYVFGFPPFYRVVQSTISEVNSNPGFWVGKRVRVGGLLTGPLLYIPEEVLPYNYRLYDSNKAEAIGVLWKDHYSDENQTVWVVGVVKTEHASSLWPGQYGKDESFIDAETVTPKLAQP